jgi:ubiquinone/menaquinone biosynthesis C-methylase UbiE
MKPLKSQSRKKDTSWESVADWYDSHLDHADTYQSRLILPQLTRLMSLRQGVSLLDLACGQGFFTADFVRRGARVVGVDSSPTLIARAAASVPSATFHCASAESLPFLSDAYFDSAACILGLQNIEHASVAIKEVGRLIRPNGSFFIVLNHPAFRIPGRSSWGWDDTLQTQYRRIDGYLHESKANIQMHPGNAPDVVTVSFHRPLQYYAKALQSAGFAILRLEEWISDKHSQPGPRAVAENTARGEFPLFLFLQAIRIP